VYDVQCSGTNAIGTFTTYNSLALSSEPQDTAVGLGGATTFNVATVGTSGSMPASSPSYQWYREGVKLTNGTQADGTVVAGATTASLGLTSVQFTSAGHYWVTVSNSLDVYNTNLNTLVVTTAAVFTTSIPASLVVTQGYSAWAMAAGLTGPNTNMAADPDGDHIVNLGEYALGLSPTVPNATGLPTLARTNSGFVFRYRRPNWVSGVTYSVLTSTDFLNWTMANPVVESLTTTSQTFVVTLPQGPPRGFARLVLTSP
jgi:hypothetical protein